MKEFMVSRIVNLRRLCHYRLYPINELEQKIVIRLAQVHTYSALWV